MKKSMFFLLFPLFTFANEWTVRFDVVTYYRDKFQNAKIVLYNSESNIKRELSGKDFLDNQILQVEDGESCWLLFEDESVRPIECPDRSSIVVYIDPDPKLYIPIEVGYHEAGKKDIIKINKADVDSIPDSIKTTLLSMHKEPNGEQYINVIDRSPLFPKASLKADLLLNPLSSLIDRSISKNISYLNFAIGAEYSPRIILKRIYDVNTLVLGVSSIYLHDFGKAGTDVDIIIGSAYIANYFKVTYYKSNYFLILPNIGYYFLSENTENGWTRKTGNIKTGVRVILKLKPLNLHADFNYHYTSGYDKAGYSIFLMSIGVTLNWFKKP
jgi:hypothetical protein